MIVSARVVFNIIVVRQFIATITVQTLRTNDNKHRILSCPICRRGLSRSRYLLFFFFPPRLFIVICRCPSRPETHKFNSGPLVFN